MKKVLIALIVSVIAGLTVWFLTHLIYRPTPRPNLQIVDVQYPEPSLLKPGDESTIKVTVFNAGDGAAKRCAVNWHIYEDRYFYKTPNEKGPFFFSAEDLLSLMKERKIEEIAIAFTKWFPLMPGESREVSISYTFKKEAAYWTSIRLFSETTLENIWANDTFMLTVY
jgi:hypothetical protein